ncbi:hypothetical protein BUE80_DR008913 [Diplocarpon rosae]|nr:hypothetical protein BUE80_DR008913 [Diplocarpon rosae]
MPSISLSRTASPKSPSASRRPKLMRAPATAPSLATSNASRQDLASLQDARAATLLTRVAISSSAQHTGGHRRQGSENDHGTGNYFSFPSFDDFQEYRQQSERHQDGVD